MVWGYTLALGHKIGFNFGLLGRSVNGWKTGKNKTLKKLVEAPVGEPMNFVGRRGPAEGALGDVLTMILLHGEEDHDKWPRICF